MKTLLVANRGEIAARVFRTARRMGMRTVAVHSDADAQAPHTRAADIAVRIGPSPARESYLDPDAILAAAAETGADAVHPGYGFLSENADFADRCVRAGLVFVGPPGTAMRAMGSKSSAKALMQAAGVPVLPGYHGDAQDFPTLADAAVRAGYPVIVKAVAGGGGRGMRVARDADGLEAALDAARQEGLGAFGDARVLLEKYLERPRHVEVQVFADTHGHAVHLGTRDCSAQRRHQKVIEEAPAPSLPGGMADGMADAMGRAAVSAALACGYVNAGTVEFIVQDGRFYFLEMNARLQVEHPVTEAVTGYDLVEWQLRIAAGERLPATQAEVRVTGHAFEARVYAEDPARDFAPSAGRITAFRMPRAARADTGYARGGVVTTHYDAMLTKIIVHGADRAAALAALRAALGDTVVAGVATNLTLLSRLAATEAFAAGGIDTGFIERHADTLLAADPPPDRRALAVAAFCLHPRGRDDGAPWSVGDGFWPNACPGFLVRFAAGAVRLRARPRGWSAEVDGQTFEGDARRAGRDRWRVRLDGRQMDVTFEGGNPCVLHMDGRVVALARPAPAGDTGTAAASARLVAALPGMVTAVHVRPGQAVRRGDVLLVMEAMKTVFRMLAQADAVVDTVGCAAGALVSEGALLVTFKPPPAA